MRKTIFAIVAVLALIAVVTSPVMASPGSSDPFKGTWKATDLDGSDMTLAIGGGVERHVTWFDQDWNCQKCNPPGNYPTVALGFGEVQGNMLTATLRWHDAPPGDWTEEYTYEWILQPDGTLWDGTLTWRKAGN